MKLKIKYSPIYLLLIVAVLGLIIYLKKKNKDQEKAQSDVKQPLFFVDSIKAEFENFFYANKSNREIGQNFNTWLNKNPSEVYRVKTVDDFIKEISIGELIEKQLITDLQAWELREFYNIGFVVENPFNQIQMPVWLSDKTTLTIWQYFNDIILDGERNKKAAFDAAINKLSLDVKSGSSSLDINQAQVNELLLLNTFDISIALSGIPDKPSDKDLKVITNIAESKAKETQEKDIKIAIGANDGKIKGSGAISLVLGDAVTIKDKIEAAKTTMINGKPAFCQLKMFKYHSACR